MFAVIYAFETHPGKETEFEQAWKGLTELIYQYENSLGSRLHHESGTRYIAYATWPDRETWKNSGGKLPPEADGFRAQMRSSCSAISTLHELEMKDDLLATTPYDED